MKQRLWPISNRVGTVVTVGTFDGVHLGHQQVIKEVVSRARRSGRKSVLVTFEPHPLEVVNPPAAPPLLTASSERREILAQSELDAAVFLRFNREMAQLSPEDFVRFLIERFGMKELVVGHDHGFGQGRKGDVSLLRDLGAPMGFSVDVVPEVDLESRAVSSTLIRRSVAGGDLETARKLLGRKYSMVASVVPGMGRGRELGYRTVNLEPEGSRKLLPPDGVYAVWVEWLGGSAGGMMHQGPRPTFNEWSRSLEIHILDSAVELYGHNLKVSWVDRLRDVSNFSSSDELREQLGKDLQAARVALTGTAGLSNH
jgi:riboflavin kinase/FMN adenylyltransferase